jgi:hypothetical protein
MGWRILADLLVVLHLAFAAFVVCGGLLTWKWRWAIFVHVPALAWGFWVETSGQICPLTPLENRFRHLAGQVGYQGGFLDHYLVPILYPPGLTRTDQWGLAVLLLVINLTAYGVLLRLRRRVP